MRRFSGWVLGGLAALALGGAAQAQPVDLADMVGAEREAFLRAMPKGADLHIHLSGAPYAEDFMAWAAQDGLCIDTEALALAEPPCDADPKLRPATEALRDGGLYGAMLDSLSTRRPGFAGRTGHDQFFTAFDRTDALPEARTGDMLAMVMERLAAQNTWYVELMITPQSRPSRMIGRGVGWKGDLAAQKAASSAAGLDALVAAAVAQTDTFEQRARTLLGCGTPQARPGCSVTVRYLAQTNRLVPLEETFAQVQLGAALVKADPRWVGVQMVAPEDHPNALRNYRDHMAMVGFLTGQGREVPVALHAGELTPAYADPEHLRFHIGEAVRVAGARRIGHGVALPYEDGAAALVREMIERGVLVEINLASNDIILELEGADHPWLWLRKAGAPYAFSTDDPGISRSDLSMEYDRAAEAGATYEDLKRSARNALAFSFLAGEGLWRDPNGYRQAHPACAADLKRVRAPSPACASLLDGSDKAREQWRLEERLRAFEAARPRR